MKKIISILLVLVFALSLAGCADKTKEEETTEETTTQQSQTTTETTTSAPVTTTEAPTVTTTAAPETTTVPDGSSIKGITDTLEGKKFYLAGVMKTASGETIDVKMTCDGEDYRMEMNSSQMKISMIYLDSNPYIVNNSTNSYILFDETAIDSLDQVLSSFSSFGVTLTGSDIEEMKSMMSDFDTNMDFSQYITDGEYSEYTAKKDNVEYLCSSYETEYGSIYIYTIDGELKMIDVYDTDGLRQIGMTVSAFIPQVLTPISLNGLKKSASILELFGLTQY